jgi:hypothetical protein
MVALSTAEAEFIELVEASKEAQALRNLREEIGISQICPINIYEDNQAVIKTLENEVFNDRNKHYSIKSHYLRDLYNKKIIKVTYIESTNQVADAMTKSLGSNLLPKHRSSMGITNGKEETMKSPL